MFIDGIGISGYRSFGRSVQEIGPLGRINLFIGQNNSGKSNILSFLTSYYQNILDAISKKQSIRYSQLDRYIGQETGQARIAFGLTIGGERYNALLTKCEEALRDNLAAMKYVEQVLRSKTLTHGQNIAWFYYSGIDSYGAPTLDSSLAMTVKSEGSLNHNEWRLLWSGLTHQSGGGLDQHWIPETLHFLSPVQFGSPKIDIIPAIRRIGEKGATTNDLSGIDLIDRLAQLQNPKHDSQQLKRQFEEINLFLRNVTGNSTAQLEVPYERDMILVHMDKKTLPLTSLGTGIHEVTILAAFATVLMDQVVCIEEPELHLHPLLQKKLIRYLVERTTNQYFITTHSAHLLDTTNARIFHVRHQEGMSTINSVYTPAAKSLVCADLGYRASDLLQANCIIWVEGPSDRIYVKHWIDQVAPELVEGVHYSIMFYGGRLLSHLSANDPEVNEFISLRSLNRYIAIIIDSDRASRGSRMNDTKRRVKEEFDGGPGFAWITKGREIENYIDPFTLENAIKAIHQNTIRLQSTGQFDHCLYYVNSRGKLVTIVDKVKIAHEVVKQPVNLEFLDLKPQMNRLVQFIRQSNDFEGT